MMSIDSYLAEVRRRLTGMDAGMQKDILLELRSHLSDSVTANGGNLGAAVHALGEPVAVARRYRELYGYGASYRLLFYAVAAGIGFLTVPVLFAGDEGIFPFFISTAFVAVEAVVLIWMSIGAGNRTGLLAGIAGVAGRFVGFGGAIVANRGGFEVTPEGLGAFLLVSLLFVAIGWIPGKAKQAWRRPGAEL